MRPVAALVAIAISVLAPGLRVIAQAEPALTVMDQVVHDDTVIVESVHVNAPAWVIVHAEAAVAGNPGQVIGRAAVQAGDTNYVAIQLDSSKITPVLYVALHGDQGEHGVYEFPGADVALQAEGMPIEARFRVLEQAVEASNETPALTVRDQVVRNATVVVGRVVAAQAGFVDIHAEANIPGNPGAVIGYAPISAGRTTYLRVPVDPARVTPTLFAVLHLDAGKVGTFEFPGPDVPVQVDAKAVTTRFQVTLAPSVAIPSAMPTATPAATATPTFTATATAVPAATGTATPVVGASAAGPTSSPTASPTATARPTLAPTPTAAPPRMLPVTGKGRAADVELGLLALPILAGLLLGARLRRRLKGA